MPFESPLRSRTNQSFGLIETLRYEPGHGCIQAQRHLARIAASAAHFGKAFNIGNAAAKLAAIKSDTPLRIRLYLDADNALSLTTHPFVPTPEGEIWTVAIATQTLDADNPLLAHKTSLRHIYETARAQFDPALVNEVLLKNQHGHLCEGTITNLFVQKGNTLITPPLQDGLLRGVLRQELLESGKASEGTILAADLWEHPFYVGNALRGLIPASLQPRPKEEAHTA
jgi:4-amino-4-deoxychorismate lyase